MIFGLSDDKKKEIVASFDKTYYIKYAYFPTKVECGRYVWLRTYKVALMRARYCRLYATNYLELPHYCRNYTRIKYTSMIKKALRFFK